MIENVPYPLAMSYGAKYHSCKEFAPNLQFEFNI